jgi:hypothetical protein
LVVLTAVGEAAFAGVTLLAVEVGFNRAEVALFYVGNAASHAENLHPEFVPWDARVREKRHFAKVAAQVCSAYSDAFDAQEGLARTGRGWFLDINLQPVVRFLEL